MPIVSVSLLYLSAIVLGLRRGLLLLTGCFWGPVFCALCSPCCWPGDHCVWGCGISLGSFSSSWYFGLSSYVFFLIVYEWMFCLHVYVYMPGAHRSQKRAVDFLRLQLQTVRSHGMGVRNQALRRIAPLSCRATSLVSVSIILLMTSWMCIFVFLG